MKPTDATPFNFFPQQIAETRLAAVVANTLPSPALAKASQIRTLAQVPQFIARPSAERAMRDGVGRRRGCRSGGGRRRLFPRCCPPCPCFPLQWTIPPLPFSLPITPSPLLLPHCCSFRTRALQSIPTLHHGWMPSMTHCSSVYGAPNTRLFLILLRVCGLGYPSLLSFLL